MKFNFLQQLGTVAAVIGLIMVFLYSQPRLPEFNIGGAIVTLRSIPEWLPGGTLFAGLGLLVVGTAWNVISGRRTDEDARDDEE